MWEICGFGEPIYTQSWPTYDENKLVADEVEIAVQLKGKLRGRIMVPASLGGKDDGEAAGERDSQRSRRRAGEEDHLRAGSPAEYRLLNNQKIKRRRRMGLKPCGGDSKSHKTPGAGSQPCSFQRGYGVPRGFKGENSKSPLIP